MPSDIAAQGGAPSRGWFAAAPGIPWQHGQTPVWALRRTRSDSLNHRTTARMVIRLRDTDRDVFANALRRVENSLSNRADREAVTKLWRRMTLARDNDAGRGYVNFLLEGVREADSEIVNVTVSHTDDFTVWAFGRSPPSAVFSGMLINSAQDAQGVAMLRAYQELTRASRLALRRSKIGIMYDGQVTYGVIHALEISRRGGFATAMPFTFSMTVTEIQYARWAEPGWQPTNPGSSQLAIESAIDADTAPEERGRMDLADVTGTSHPSSEALRGGRAMME